MFAVVLYIFQRRAGTGMRARLSNPSPSHLGDRSPQGTKLACRKEKYVRGEKRVRAVVAAGNAARRTSEGKAEWRG